MHKHKNLECESCGGHYRFDPDSQSLICQKCGSLVAITKDNSYPSHLLKMDGEIPDLKVAKTVTGHCSSCGAITKSNGATITNICQYCGANVIIDFSSGDTVPDACIPFAFGTKEAKNYFHNGIKKAKFLPNGFKKDPPDDNIEAIYFPAFKFDFETVTKYSGILEEKHSDENGTHYHYKNVAGDYSSKDYDLILECSDYLTQSTLLSLSPYNTQGLVKFNSDFVLGYSVEHFNRKMQDMRNWAKNTVRESIKRKILNSYSFNTVHNFKMDISYLKSDYSYIILPAYKINYKYKNKDYNTYINGQTGKLGGNIPRSSLKIALFVLGILAVVGGFVGLFTLL